MNLQRVWLLIFLTLLFGGLLALLSEPVGDDLPQGPLVTETSTDFGPATPYQVDENDP